MILTKSENTRLCNVLRDMCGSNGITDILPFREISKYEKCITIDLGDSRMYISIDKDYGMEVGHHLSYYYWKLYLKNRLGFDNNIDRREDGLWWDIIRNEIPILEQKVDDYHRSMELRRHQESERNLMKRANQLRKYEDYINGRRWWKFWWKRK